MKNIPEIVWMIVVVAMSFTFWRYGVDSTKEKQPNCNCVSAYEYKCMFEDYQMYVDSLVWSGLRKDKVKRLQDSVISKMNKLNF